MIHCPYCGSDDIDRIGLYEYQCNSCMELFDANEVKENDDNWYPDEDRDTPSNEDDD